MAESLRDYRADVYSQFGEDGMIRHALGVLPSTGRWCVELGAWNGKFCSNTHRLMSEEGWSGVFIEADADKFQKLQETYAGNPLAECVHALVDFTGRDLDSVLARTGIPREPTLVVIEFNPTIPNDILFVQPADMAVHQGSSLAAIVELASAKGYELVATTEVNAFFVREALLPLFDIPDNSLDALRPGREHETRVFQLFDGTLCWDGPTELLWHAVRFSQPQIIPRCLRSLPGTESSPAKRQARKRYVAFLRLASRWTARLRGE
jgi:hypothetical protein